MIFRQLANKDWLVGVRGGDGNDTVSFAKFGLGVKADLSTGSAFDTGAGNFLFAGFENIIGSTMADELVGNGVNNAISGGNGNDKIVGGLGADVLTGGLGADRFIYTDLKESTRNSSGRDTITDFSKAEGDRIDLKAIDAIKATATDDAFKFIGKTAAFSINAGELRFEHSGSNTFVYADVDGDGVADFSIKLAGQIDLVKADFVV